MNFLFEQHNKLKIVMCESVVNNITIIFSFISFTKRLFNNPWHLEDWRDCWMKVWMELRDTDILDLGLTYALDGMPICNTTKQGYTKDFKITL